MKKICVTLITVLLSVPLFAQEGPIRASSQNPFWELMVRYIEIEEANKAMGEDPNSIENIEGSPYYPEEFAKGNVYMLDKVKQKGVYLRYNMLSDEIEIKENKYSEEYAALIKDPQIYARVADRTMIFAPYLESVEKGGYFSLVSSGNPYDLYKKSTVEFKEFKTTTAYSGAQKAKFEMTEDYYLVNKKGNFFKLPQTRNKILKVMDEFEDEVRNYISSRNIILSEEKNVISLFNYYNVLLTRKAIAEEGK